MPDITITTTIQQAQRISVAMGQWLALENAQGQPRPATAQEVKTFLVKYLKQTVEQMELREAAKQAVSPPLEIT